MAPPGRTSWAKRGCLVIALILAAAVAFAPIQCMIWDGGFEAAEVRLTFVDAAGRPVPGVTLDVMTKAGGSCYLYPVNEFVPDGGPTSDAHGRMVFHHVDLGLEFGGRDYYSLTGIRWSKEGAPQYVCVFRLGGGEVYRTRYDDLRPGRQKDNPPEVERPWLLSDWPAREYGEHPGEWAVRRRELFDGNRDGELDREERVAAHYFERYAFLREDRPNRPVRFRVTERTVTIP